MLRQRTNSLRRPRLDSDAEGLPQSPTESVGGFNVDSDPVSDDAEFVERTTERPQRIIRQTETTLSQVWIIALASPIANWLTGTDHVLYFLLLLLFTFYLHQVVEVPWNLYQNARARGGITSENSTIPAISELRKLELIFLGVSVLSPVLGALILRFASQVITGKDHISWFSITLFVLATGIRPWRHLVHRLEDRTQDLHDAIHYTSDGKLTFEDLYLRLDKLERAFQKFKIQTKEELDEVYDYAEEAVDVLDKSGQKLERKSDKNDERVKALEGELETLKQAQRSKEREALMHISTHPTPPSFRALASYYLPTWIQKIAGIQRKMQPISPRSPPLTKYPRTLGSSSPLRTIPEEAPQKDTSSILMPYLSWLPGSVLLVYIIEFITLPLRAFVHFISSVS